MEQYCVSYSFMHGNACNNFIPERSSMPWNSKLQVNTTKDDTKIKRIKLKDDIEIKENIDILDHVS